MASTTISIFVSQGTWSCSLLVLHLLPAGDLSNFGEQVNLIPVTILKSLLRKFDVIPVFGIFSALFLSKIKFRSINPVVVPA